MACPAGAACRGDGTKRDCPAGAWFQPAPQQPTCARPKTACADGDVETAAPTATSDRMCVPDTAPPTFDNCPAATVVAVAVSGPVGGATAPTTPANTTGAATAGVAVLEWVPITASDANRLVSVSPPLGELASGGVFEAGRHDLAFEAADVAGNTAWCNFTVVVLGPDSAGTFPAVGCVSNGA